MSANIYNKFPTDYWMKSIPFCCTFSPFFFRSACMHFESPILSVHGAKKNKCFRPTSFSPSLSLLLRLSTAAQGVIFVRGCCLLPWVWRKAIYLPVYAYFHFRQGWDGETSRLDSHYAGLFHFQCKRRRRKKTKANVTPSISL